MNIYIYIKVIPQLLSEIYTVHLRAPTQRHGGIDIGAKSLLARTALAAICVTITINFKWNNRLP